MNEKQKAMCALQKASFALIETVLYLDGHPCDKSALEYYEKVKEIHRDAVRDYEENFGPVSVLGVSSEESWTWVETPWPWEMEESC